jgi:hypothetical protein
MNDIKHYPKRQVRIGDWRACVYGLVSTREEIGPDVTSKHIYLSPDIESPNMFGPYYFIQLQKPHYKFDYIISDGDRCWICHQVDAVPPHSLGSEYPFSFKVGIELIKWHKVINWAIEAFHAEEEDED